VNWGATSRLQGFWDIRAACNFIGGGTGSSLLVWAAIGLIAGLPYFPAAVVGLIFVAGGLFMVWLEIGKPWRAFNLFFRPQTSWMTREGIVALPLFAVGAISVLFALDTGRLVPAASPLVPAIITAVLSLAFLYCQLRVIHSARGLPAWREPKAMPLLGLSGLTEGIGLYLLVTAVLGYLPVFMMVIALTMVIARAFGWHSYMMAMNRSGAPEPTMTALRAMNSGFLIVGHVLPVLLIAFGVIWPAIAMAMSALAGVIAALAGWFLKITLVTKAGFIPKYEIPTAPVRGRHGPLSRTTGD
jgi:phenylacetyl-CoA:acceptor oxidoreductase subunit 2